MPSMHRHHPPQWETSTADEALVIYAQGGEREAFGALYDRYLPRFHGYCYQLLGNREAAEDATTEVFLRALAALPAFSTGSFRAWLFTLAHHVVVDELRRRRPAVPLADVTDLLNPAPSLDEVAAMRAEQATVLALLPRLSLDQQHVVALRLSGLSAVEIGAALGKPRNAVDGLQHRALLRLRSLLVTRAPTATTGGR